MKDIYTLNKFKDRYAHEKHMNKIDTMLNGYDEKMELELQRFERDLSRIYNDDSKKRIIKNLSKKDRELTQPVINAAQLRSTLYNTRTKIANKISVINDVSTLLPEIDLTKKSNEIIELAVNKKRQSLINEKKKAIERTSNIVRVVAPEISNIVELGSSSTILKGYKKEKKSLYVPHNKEDLNKMAEIFNYLTKTSKEFMNAKGSSSMELQRKVIEFNEFQNQHTTLRMNNRYSNMEKAIKNLNDTATDLVVFDTETIGGKNEHGKRTLDSIVEYSFDLYSKGDNEKWDPSSRKLHNGVIGIPDAQVDMYKQMIRDISVNGITNERQRIAAETFLKYGSEGVEIDETDFTVKTTSTYTPPTEADMKNIGKLEAGLNRLVDVNKKQQATSVDGITKYERDFINFLSLMSKDYKGSKIDGKTISSNVAFSTQYGTQSDMPWINQALTNGLLSDKAKKELIDKVGSDFIDFDASRHVDFFDILSAYETTGKKSKLYTPGSEILKEFSYRKQEAIGKENFPHLYEDGAAHFAANDTNALFHLLTQNSTNTRMLDYKNPSTNDGLPKLYNPYEEMTAEILSDNFKKNANIGKQFSVQDYRNLVLFSDSSINLGEMGFVYDPMDQKYKTGNNLVIGNNEVKSQLIGENGVSKNSTYNIKNIGSYDLSDADIETIRKINPAMAQRKLFKITLGHEFDKSVAGADNRLGFHNELNYMFRSEDEMHSFLDKFIVLGEKDEDGKIVSYLEDSDIENLLQRQNIDKELLEPIKGGTTPEEIRRHSTWKNLNEPAARKYRNHRLKDNNKVYSFIDEMYKELNTDKISDVRKAMSSLVSALGEAKKLSSGEKITLDEQHQKMLSIVKERLGFESTTESGPQIFRQTFDSYMSGLEYYESVRPIHEAIKSKVFNLHEDVQNSHYAYVMNNTVADISRNRNEFLNSTDNSIYRHEGNHIDIDTSGFSRKGNVLGGETTNPNIKSIRIKNNAAFDIERIAYEAYNVGEFKSLDNMSNARREAIKLNNLKRFANDVAINNPHFKSLKGIVKNAKDFSSKELSQKIFEEMKRVHDKDPAKVKINQPIIQDVTHSLKSMSNTTKEEAIEIANKYLNNLPNVVYLGDNNLKDLKQNTVESFVDNFIFNSSTESMEKKINTAMKNDPVKGEYLNRLYSIVRKDAASISKDYINMIHQGGADFFYDTKKKTAGFIKDNTFHSLDSFMKINFENGAFTMDVGNTRLNVNSALEYNPHSKEPKSSIVSNVMRAWREMGFSKYNSIDKAIEDGRFENQAISIMGNFAEKLRENSGVTTMNVSEKLKTFSVDINDLVKNLPQFYHENKGEFRKILGERDGEKFEDKFKRILDLTIENKGDRSEINELNFEKLNSTQREAIYRHSINLLRSIADKTDDQDLKFIASNLSFTGTENDASRGILHIGNSSTAGASGFNSNQRPLVGQNKFITYSKSHLKDKLIERGLEPDLYETQGLFGSSMSATYMTYNDALLGDMYTEVRSDRLDTSTIGYQKIIKNAADKDTIYKNLEKKYKDRFSVSEIRDMSEKLTKVLASQNIYNDAAIIDGRMANLALERTEYQKISVRKELFANINDLNKFIRNQEQFQEKIMPSIKLNPTTGKVETLVFGEGTDVKRYDKILSTVGFNNGEDEFFAKREGKFSYGYFSKDGGVLLKEKDILKSIQDMNFNSEDEAYEYLNNKFDASFYVRTMNSQAYNKILIGGSEKMEAQSLELGAGSIDKDISTALDEIDNGKKYKNKVLRTHEDILDLAQSLSDTDTFKGKSINEIVGMITEERDAANSVLFDDILENKVSLITDNNDLKHKNAGHAAEGILGSLQKELELNREEFAKLINQYDIFGGGVDIQDGYLVPKVTVGGNEAGEYINYKGIEKLIEDNNLTDKYFLGESEKSGKSYGKKFEVNRENLGVIKDTSITAFDEHEGNTGFFSGELDTIKAKIQRYEEQSIEQPLSIEEKQSMNKLMVRQSELERASRKIDKGMKISSREVGMLNLNAYDKYFEKAINDESLNENFDLNEYSDYIEKNTEGRYITNDKIKGKAMLNDVTKTLSNRVIKGKDKEDGVVRREMRDSLATARDAIFYNDGKVEIDTLRDKGFTDVNIGDIVTATPGNKEELMQLGDDNIYEGKHIIDLGEDFKSNRFLAVPEMPVKELSDSYIKTNFQSEINSLVSAHRNYEDVLSGANTKTDKEKAYNNVLLAKEKVSRTIRKDTFGKDGLFSMASSTRLERSYMGKANTSVYLTEHEGLDLDVLDFQNKNSMYNKSEFKGQKLSTLYDKGIFIDSVSGSEKVFEDMGYFEQEYMEKVFNESGSEKELREKMMHELETKGTMALVGRPPTTTEGSIKPSMFYLDRTLQEGEITRSVFSQMSEAGDNDGDNSALSIIESKQSKDYLEAQLSGKTDEFKSRELLLMRRATSTNKIYQRRFMQDMVDGVASISNKGLIEDYAIGDKIYSEFNTRPDFDEVLRQNAIANEFFENYSKEDVKVRDIKNNHAYSTEIDDMLSRVDDEVKREEYKHAAIFDRLIGETELTEVTKAKKKSIGETNIPLWRLRAMSLASSSENVDLTSANRRVIQSGAQIVEQEVISSKHASAVQYFEKVDDFKNAMLKMNSGSGESMRKWMHTNIEGLKSRVVDEAEILAAEGYENYINFFNDKGVIEGTEDDLFKTYVDDFTNSGSRVGTSNVNKVANAIKLGQNINGVSADDILDIAFSGGSTLSGQVMKQIYDENEIEYEFLDDEKLRHKVLDYDFDSAFDNKNSTLKDIKFIAGETIQKEAAKMKGGGIGGTLAKGAMGLAGAYLLAGYAAGNPIDDAGTQAHMQSESGYSIPMLGDPNSLTMGGNTGYLININANTEVGAEAISEAIQGVSNSTLPASVNMRVNIQNDKSNINDIYIQNLLAGAIQ